MPNGETKKEVERLYNEVDELLDEPKLNTREALKGILRTNRIIMAYFFDTAWEDHKTLQEDHDKIGKIWPMYKALIFISSAIGLSIIALIWALITGQAELILK